MRRIGYILITVGLALLVFAVYSYFTRNSGIVSPVPEDGGIKVIYLTPGA
jgi:hypothetical protein